MLFASNAFVLPCGVSGNFIVADNMHTPNFVSISEVNNSEIDEFPLAPNVQSVNNKLQLLIK